MIEGGGALARKDPMFTTKTKIPAVLAVLAVGLTLMLAGCGSAADSGQDTMCAGWWQTSDCMANGRLEPSKNQGCATTIQSGWSGYCDCGGAVVGQVDCGHPEFTCEQVCAAW